MQKHLKDYNQLIKEIDCMKSTRDFNLKTLRRKIRKYCITQGSANYLRLQLKCFKNIIPSPSLYIQIEVNPFPFNALYTAKIVQPFSKNIESFSFDFDDNKELLKKIIKHDLLIKLY